MTRLSIIACLALAATAAFAGQIENGVLMVDGTPFFPLGGWDNGDTTPDDLARLGMNISFRGGPRTAEGVDAFRPFVRECVALGIQVVPYLSYGGAGVTPWPPEAVRSIAALASEPNLLAWYVGDDITMKHLDGIRQTVTILRQETPDVPAVADYIADETPEAQTTFTKFIDIRCQYTYPIPEKPYTEYLAFFDRQREFVGDPLWTWVQCFMWGSTGARLDTGAEGPGPIPDPEQVRLLAFAAINRGVRGLLFFPHHELRRLPEVSAEVALVCREVGLVSRHLAAGEATYNLPTSQPDVNATAFRYHDSVVLSVALFKDTYHRWVDAAVVGPFTVECPWPQGDPPTALLVATPDVVACGVAPADRPGAVTVTIPSLELAGFVLLSSDARELETLREGTAAIPEPMTTLVAQASATQARKVANVVWRMGHDNLYATPVVVEAMRSVERCADAVAAQKSVEAFVAWRETLRQCRRILDDTMHYAESRQALIPPQQRKFLLSPYGLHNIRGLGQAPSPDDPWRFIMSWRVAGPFPLEWDEEFTDKIPAGFDRAYAPEQTDDLTAVFDSMDGPTRWTPAGGDLSGLLDFLPLFASTENTIAYARCRIHAPEDMEVRMSLGSNDGAKVWVNGAEVFSWCSVPDGGRTASPHQDEFTVNLKAGANPVLVKVENLGANWQLYLSIHDPGRKLRFDAH